MLARVVFFRYFFILLVLLDGSPRHISATGAHLNEDDAILLHGLEKFTKNNVPSLELSSSTNFCHSCLETAKKTREVLGDHPTFFKEIGNFVTTFCSSQVKCKNTAIIFLQEGLLEEKLCNTMEFCPENGQEGSSTSGKMGLLSAIDHLSGILRVVQEGSPVINKVAWLFGRENYDQIHLQSNQTSCNACLHLLDKLRTELEDPDKQMKIIASLLKACETEVSVYRCKKLVFLYAPMVIADLREIVSVDLCHWLHICNKDLAPETRYS